MAFPIGQRVEADFAASRELILGDPDLSSLYLEDGDDYKMGDRFINENLCYNNGGNCGTWSCGIL